MTATQTPKIDSVIGQPHYELVNRTGYRESLIGRYDTKATAQLEAQIRKDSGFYDGSFVIRYREC